jgi:cell division protein FtsB
MNSGELMVVLIVAIVMVTSIVRARYGYGRFGRFDRGNPEMEGQSRAENQRLRDEVSELKERIKVLERITVEKENSLAKEIESLRDR